MEIIHKPNPIGSRQFFGHVHKGEKFTYGGNEYVKRSSRTAMMLSFPSNPIRYFYSNDYVIITAHADSY